MHAYLKATHLATKALFHILTEDTKKIQELTHQLVKILISANTTGVGFKLGKDDRWVINGNERLFTEKQKTELEHLKNESSRIEQEVKGKEESLAAISMSILQIAKQGLSTIYASRNSVLKNAPYCREIYGIPIQQVIWDGRNHALHYEESPNHNSNTKETFLKLEDVFYEEISLEANPKKCLAKKLLEIMEWDSYDAYLKDMNKLIKE